MEALREAFESPDCAAIVLSSTDPAAFCSGADVSLEDAERAEVSDLPYTLYGRMISAPATIVVAVGGHAVGGRAQLAIAGDVRIAGPSWIEPAPEEAAVALATSFARLASEPVARVKRIAAEATGLLAALELERTGNRAWSGSMSGSEPPG